MGDAKVVRDQRARSRVRGYPLLIVGLLALLLVAFLAVEALGVPLLTDPGPWLDEAGVAAAAIGVGLLVADVLIPVPSSAVMVAQGALFGVVGGALLSLVGSVGATAFAFLLGRRSRPLVHRLVPPDQRARAEQLLVRHGTLAILLTRPVPMLAETTAVVAGTTAMPWRSAVVAGAAGNLVPAVLYALAGAAAASLTSQALVFGLVLVVALAFWLVERSLRRRGTAPRPTS